MANQPNETPEWDTSRRSVNLRTQVALLLALATLPVGVLAVAQGLAAYRETQTLRLSSIARDAIEASREERGAIVEAFGSITALDSLVDFNAPVGSCNDVFESYVRTSGRVSFVGVFNRSGRMKCGHPFVKNLDISGAPEYQRFLKNPRKTVTAYATGAVSGVPVLVASAPLEREGEVLGSLAISLPSHYLNWVSSEGPIDPSGRFAILGRDGVKVAHSGASADEPWLPTSREELLSLLASDEPRLLKTEAGEWRIFSATPLFERDVFALASWPQERTAQGPSLVQFATLILPIVMWALAVAVAYYAVDRFALRHVLYLDRLVSAYGRTRRKLRAKGVRAAPREFAQLGASFDDMATEIESRETDLRQSLEEKNVLLKEVYHRVKNNLQLIISLINMQLRDAEHERERDGLTRLQDRVYGLAAVHQMLYEAEGLEAVRIDALIREIAINAKGSRGPGASDFKLDFALIDWEEPAERAMPISLFATEAIANAFKHALEFGKGGWLAIRLEKDGDNLALEVENWVDPSLAEATAPRVGLGTQLIDGFVRQLRGNLERTVSYDSYKLRLVFPAHPDDEIAATQA